MAEVDTRAGPRVPEVIVWIDTRHDDLVAEQVFDAAEPVTFAAVLEEAIRAPLAGKPRRPNRVRVATEALAVEVRSVLGPDADVVVAPTPEIEMLGQELHQMIEDADARSYLAGGSISPDLVERMFLAAGDLYVQAPWEALSDDEPLRLDIPQFGIHGALVSINGQKKERLGVVIFPDWDAFEHFSERVGALHPREEATDDEGLVIALTFDDEEEVTRELQREVAGHDWPLPEPDLYPILVIASRHGAPRPLDLRHMEIMTVCLQSLAMLFDREPGILNDDRVEPFSCAFYVNGRVRVELTYPHDSYDEFEQANFAPVGSAHHASRPRVGRNDPCPCGSGKKYKKCHLQADENAARGEQVTASARIDPQTSGLPAERDLEGPLLQRILQMAMNRFPKELEKTLQNFTATEDVFENLGVQWAACHGQARGRRFLDWFLQEQGRGCSANERAWIESQQHAWLSVWEVQDVQPGRRVTVRDLLSGEARDVFETSASRALVRRDAILARVVDHEHQSLFFGVHPRFLPPDFAAEVVERVETHLHHKAPVATGDLQKVAFGRFLLQSWEDAIEDYAIARSTPPRLHNTDGDRMIQITDRFRFAPAARAQVASALESIAGVERVSDDAIAEPRLGVALYQLTKPGNPMNAAMDRTLVARIEVDSATLRVETNSVERADRVRSAIESACGDHLEHEHSEQFDIEGELLAGYGADRRARSSGNDAEELPAAEGAAIIVEHKRRFYADWADVPLPVLGGQTPRAAARVVRGRAEVDILLKSMENHEARLPPEQRFDFTGIRRDLRLDL